MIVVEVFTIPKRCLKPGFFKLLNSCESYIIYLGNMQDRKVTDEVVKWMYIRTVYSLKTRSKRAVLWCLNCTTPSFVFCPLVSPQRINFAPCMFHQLGKESSSFLSSILCYQNTFILYFLRPSKEKALLE